MVQIYSFFGSVWEESKNIVSFVDMKRILTYFAFMALLTSCGVFFTSESRGIPPSDEVVDIGYGKEVRKNLTSSVSSVNIDTDVMPYRDIYELIQGKCAGVVVQGNKVTIRGTSSINSSTEPLFIVNGAPQSSIEWINPNDVKSIDVLKDAGSAAIYGSRGANGVIIINLK